MTLLNLKNSLNNIGISIQVAINEIQRIADHYAKGNFAAEFDRSLKITGDLATVRDGLDLISTDVSKVLSVVTTEMIQPLKQIRACFIRRRGRCTGS